MRLEILSNYEALSQRAAAIVGVLVASKPSAVLGLPTGSTPVGFYEALTTLELNWQKVRTFNLDEYLSLGPDHPQSYYTFMQENLYSKIGINPANTHIPNGLASDPEAECAAYEAKIRSAGGLDVVVLGLGHNGHIGFNEPGSPWDAPTRVVELAERTREANARFFGSREAVPTRALTMGIGTILGARQILLLASGSSKAEPIRRLMEETPTTDFPAHALRSHPNVTVLLDTDSAHLLQAAGRVSR